MTFIPRLHDQASIEPALPASFMLAGRASSSTQPYRVNGVLDGNWGLPFKPSTCRLR